MIRLPASQLLSLLNREEISAAELTQAYLAAIRRHENQIKAFLHVDEERAMARAHALDENAHVVKLWDCCAGCRWRSRTSLCTAGQPTTCGSKILQNFVPPYDAHVITRLRRGRRRVCSARRTWTSSPWARPRRTAPTRSRAIRGIRTCIPGGSSGGSAAAVAACLGAAGHRHRYRRLHPPARRPVRHRRPQAQLWPGVALRPDRLRQLARPGRPLRPRRCRGRPAAGSDRRPRSAATAPASTRPCLHYTGQSGAADRSR